MYDLERSPFNKATVAWMIATMSLISVMLFAAPSVSAHAYIVKSNPTVNESYTTPPPQVQIWFDESVQAVFNALTVQNQNGQRVDLRDAHIDSSNPTLLECSLPSQLPKGMYTVQWRVVSADGHPVKGVIPFAVGEQVAGHVEHATVNYLPTTDLIILRWMTYVGLTLFVGVLLFWLVILPRDIRQIGRIEYRFQWTMRIIGVGLLVAILLSLPMQARVDSGVYWAQAFSPVLLRNALWYSSFGHIWLLQLALVLLVLILMMSVDLVSAKVARFGLWSSAFIVGVVLLLTKSLMSHAAARPDPHFPVFMDFAHLFGVGVWLGSLYGFAFLLPHTRPQPQSDDNRPYWQAIRKFSPWGFGSVFVIIVTGTYASLYNIPTWYGLFHTIYGRTLMIKVGGFLVMGLFGMTHFIRGARTHTKSEPIPKLTIWIQLTLGLVILGVSGVLANLPNARATPGTYMLTRSLGNGVSATLDITPNVAGQNTITVKFEQGSHPFTNIAQTSVGFTSLQMNMGTDTVRMIPTESGQYQVTGLYLNMAGEWDIHIHVLTNDLNDIDEDFHALVGANQ